MRQQVEAGLGPDGRPVAVKRAAGPIAIGRLEREAAVLTSVRHPGVVEVLEFVKNEVDATLTMRWVTGGPLLTAIDQRRDRVLLLRVLADAAATVADLHDCSVAHGRLDATHILLSDDECAMLCGFAEAGAGAEPSADVAAIGALAAEIAALPAARTHRALPNPPGIDEPGLRQAIERATDPDGARRLPARALSDLLAGVLPPSPAKQARVVAQRHGPPVTPSRHRWDRAHLLVASGVAFAGAAVSVALVIPAFRGPPGATVVAPLPARDQPTTTPSTRASILTSASSLSASTGAPRRTAAATGVRRWPTSCPPTTSATTADVNGDGCADDITVSGSSIDAAGHHYTLGVGGTDLVVFGDWNCRGIATPAVLHSSSGAVDVFDSWPTPAQRSITARRVGTFANARSLAARPMNNGCDVLVVSAVDGDHMVAP